LTEVAGGSKNRLATLIAEKRLTRRARPLVGAYDHAPLRAVTVTDRAVTGAAEGHEVRRVKCSAGVVVDADEVMDGQLVGAVASAAGAVAFAHFGAYVSPRVGRVERATGCASRCLAVWSARSTVVSCAAGGAAAVRGLAGLRDVDALAVEADDAGWHVRG
jgi:hypothetical protein